jgi:hypothetical protein
MDMAKPMPAIFFGHDNPLNAFYVYGLNFLCSRYWSFEGTGAAPHRLMPDDLAPRSIR